MKKIVAPAVLAFALIAGTAAVLTLHPQLAIADCGTPSC